jgi:glycosyltransferase involved in cell wall biosynthesis
MSEIRVVLDGSVLGWGHGGIPRYLRNVLAHMAKEEDLLIELLANSRFPVAQIEGVSERDLRIKGGIVWRSTVLVGSLLVHRPDVYWLPTTTPPPFIPRPYVVTVHDLAPVIFPSSKGKSGTIAFRTTYRRAVTRADHVLAVSEATARDLREIWSVPAERITVVPLGVSGFFTPGNRDEAVRRVTDLFGVSGPFALVAGTIEERKGLEIAVDIAESSPGFQVVFAGRNGFGHEAVVSRGRKAGAVFLGEVDDTSLLDLYRAAEVLLVPSIYEGFGLTPLEAMACGCPVVIAGDAGSMDELYPEAGRVVADRTVAAWMDAISDVRTDRGKWALAGRQLAGSFTWEATADATAGVLRSVATAARRARVT